ncbi:MerR family transcriptional regulator [Actinoplanes sp. NPDC049265]|uniref:MerR family transcriptional regulator n=1 Tax=Actinoplanes sp. NPDC049265 TaxID=3363902 RepID=UPI00371E1096
MATLTIQEASRQCGMSEPTLRYYEEVGLIGPITRDERSGHRRYGDDDVNTLEVLACLRAVGVGIEEMRTYLANRSRGRAAYAEQRDILLRHAERVEEEIAAQQARLGYLRIKAALWDARHRDDAKAEADAAGRVPGAAKRMIHADAATGAARRMIHPDAMPGAAKRMIHADAANG